MKDHGSEQNYMGFEKTGGGVIAGSKTTSGFENLLG